MFTPPPPPKPVPEIVPHTILCLGCRYDLVGLATNGLCRRVHALSGLVADAALSRWFLAPAIAVNVLGFAYASVLAFLLFARGEPVWILLTAALWYPLVACPFWILVLTRLIRGTANTLSTRADAP